jgi:hypothetical protein
MRDKSITQGPYSGVFLNGEALSQRISVASQSSDGRLWFRRISMAPTDESNCPGRVAAPMAVSSCQHE